MSSVIRPNISGDCEKKRILLSQLISCLTLETLDYLRLEQVKILCCLWLVEKSKKRKPLFGIKDISLNTWYEDCIVTQQNSKKEVLSEWWCLLSLGDRIYMICIFLFLISWLFQCTSFQNFSHIKKKLIISWDFALLNT